MSAIEMQVTTRSLPNSRIAVEMVVPAERCQASYQEALARLSRSVKLPGFRKGKVPKAVLIQRIGIPQIKASALEALIDEAWKTSLKQEAIEPLCEPELSGGFEDLFENFNPDQALTVTLETDIAPTPKLKQTKDLVAEVETIAFDPTKVDELIEQSRKQLATVVPVEKRPAAMGDIAVVSFKGTYSDDGSEIEGGSADSMDIDLENGQMIPGFIEGIIGMELDNTKTIQCHFPEDYPQEDARGRTANFAITLQDLKIRELPKLDDSFAQQASDKTTLKELRAELEQRLKDDAKRRDSSNRKDALTDSLVKQLEVEIPKTLLDIEVRNLVEQTAQKFAQQGMDVKSMFTPELVQSLMQSSRPEAEDNLKRKLALNALSEKEKIKVENKEIEDKLEELKPQFADQKNIDPERLKQAVSEDLLQEKVIQWLEENNTVIEKSPKVNSENTESSDKAKSTKGKTANKSKTLKETKNEPKTKD